MTFSRPLSGSIAFEGIVTSAFLNALNTNTAKALDKTGDNLGTSPPGGVTGEIEFLNGSQLLMDYGSTFNINGNFNISSPVVSVLANGFIFEAATFLQINSSATITLLGTLTCGGITLNDSKFSAADSQGYISLGSGAFASNLSFSGGVATPTITQVGQNFIAANGNPLYVVAQAAGSSSLASGGNLNLLGGQAISGTGGNVIISGGTGGAANGTVLIGSGVINSQPVTLQGQSINGWVGNNNGQAAESVEARVLIESTGGATVHYSFTMPSNTSAMIEVSWIARDLTNIANVGFGKINLSYINNSGTVSVVGSPIAYGYGSSGAGTNLALGAVSPAFAGTTIGYFVNDNAYTNNTLWTLNTRITCN